MPTPWLTAAQSWSPHSSPLMARWQRRWEKAELALQVAPLADKATFCQPTTRPDGEQKYYDADSMMTSWRGDALCITGPLWGKSTCAFPHKVPVMRSFLRYLLLLTWTVEQRDKLLVQSNNNEIGITVIVWDNPQTSGEILLHRASKYIKFFLVIASSKSQRLVWVHHLPCHNDVIKWKHFPRYWRFVRGIHRWAVNSPHKGQWRGAFMFSLICAWINGWANNDGDLRRHLAHYDVIVMQQWYHVTPDHVMTGTRAPPLSL